MGMPIHPCTCSKECDAALFENIGLPMEDRRKKAGIALFQPNVQVRHDRDSSGTQDTKH